MKIELLVSKVKALLRKIIGYPVLYNVNKADENLLKKRALLIYLVKPFRLDKNDPKFLTHQNLKQTLQIASVLNQIGYIVDVADIKSKRILSKKKYDLLISHNFKLDISTLNLTQNAIKIYLASGMNHIINNINIKKRYADLYKRKGCKLKIRRLNDENMKYVEQADYIIGFGNQFTMDTWSKNFKQKKYYFNNYGFEKIKYIEKDFNLAKKNFLYFASSNQVGKGLDLLLEIFPKHPDLNLYVCGNYENEEDFCKCYHTELYETPNIHPVGWVQVGSDKFYELVEKCAFVIMPSCSEGQPGSVINCMYAGLIPMVTKETGIELNESVIYFDSYSLNDIEKKITEIIIYPFGWYKEQSLNIKNIVVHKYSEQFFNERLISILTEIINN